MKKIEFVGTLIENTPISQDTNILTLHIPELAGAFQAGQFMEIDCGGYILRPFGLMSQDSVKGSINVGVKIVGKSSGYLASLSLGQKVRILGPLGNGFCLDSFDTVIAVGGGSGIFPLYEAINRCNKKGIDASLICGFRSEEEAFPRGLFEALDVNVFFSSDHGGLDFHGHAGSCLKHFFPPEQLKKNTLLIACGPKPLLAYVKKYAEENKLSCQLSLEENMACGLGLCTGCVVDIINDQGELDRVRCCVDGPVFEASRLIL